MTVIAIALTDVEPTRKLWETPPDPVALRSPIPMGTIKFQNSGAVAAKGANDETNLSLKLTMPSGYVYLPRFIETRFTSDDLVETYNANAFGHYVFASGDNSFITFNMTSPGQFIEGAIKAEKIWIPGLGTPKILMRPTDTLNFGFADMDAGATTAGDLFWAVELYVFNVDQIDKWEVNTPIPIIDHASF